jgi:hypothetical protein
MKGDEEGPQLKHFPAEIAPRAEARRHFKAVRVWFAGQNATNKEPRERFRDSEKSESALGCELLHRAVNYRF